MNEAHTCEKKTEDQAKQLCVFDVCLLGLGHLRTLFDSDMRCINTLFHNVLIHLMSLSCARYSRCSMISYSIITKGIYQSERCMRKCLGHLRYSIITKDIYQKCPDEIKKKLLKKTK